MKISVITIVYNDVKNILKTINSVFNQYSKNMIEYIVIDGLSNDGTSKIISENIQHIDKYVCEKDAGIYDAMNKGLKLASGDFVIFLNSGDEFYSNDTVSHVINSIENCACNPIIVYGSYLEKGERCIIPCRKPNKIWYGMIASHQSIFYNLKFLRQHNLKYDIAYRIAADYKLTLEVLTINKDCYLKLNECISKFDTTGISSTNANLGLKEANRARREILKYGNFKIVLLSMLLITARTIKNNLTPLYHIIRNN